MNKKKAFNLGFTLIEILIVLAIITLVISLGIPSVIGVGMQKLNSTTRQFVGLIRTVRNDAILLNQVQRLVIDLTNQTYWIEYQSKPGLLVDPTMKNYQKEDLQQANSGFSRSNKYSKSPKELPSGIVFRAVVTEYEGFLSDGTVYIHFFPNGFNERAILQIAKEHSLESVYSIIISSSAGRIEVANEAINSFHQSTSNN